MGWKPRLVDGRARVIRYKLYPATYTQHGKKYMGFSQQLNLCLAYLKENLVSLFERKHTTNIIFEFDVRFNVLLDVRFNARVGCRVGFPV